MSQHRLLSLDVLRGLTVIGMVVVNSAAMFSVEGERDAYALLLHASWNGATLADMVFPFFLLIVGVSIPFALSSLKERQGLERKVFLRLLWRGSLLFLIGVVLAAYFFDPDGERQFRIMGVLQRIGIVFFAAAVIFMVTGWRAQLMITAALLLGYWGMCLLPFPDGGTDLGVPGQNFVHWVDRLILGQRLYVTEGPYPYDPEGLLSSLPGIAQALIGVLVGQVIRRKGAMESHLGTLFIAGGLMALAGWGWSYVYPLNKALWSSSFVLYTSGLGILLLALLIYVIDVRGWKAGWTPPCAAFGLNAITAYVWHAFATSIVLYGIIGETAYTFGLSFLDPKAAMALPILAAVILTWIPIAVLQWRGIVIKV
ncbi:acyltransferase family protein [Paremcibacter congregatus]|uniref:Heparan-alpha-glucosaminide N-acetyltransferase catalytic domain-containing protein n=1 Tax=Paremcibacter congregatus TaxID=2043170 RepID=A0A2G4YR61_9PROT|nr:DUF5009 domain-containing protein [Paremcibacter congregatus]PHZ84824.1 hypothetical protein CRD36_08835 [Paremcibacter congregatus]QDE26202.1 DUF5009 domain-containing protein [Paremcibacter congregatus]